MEQDGTTETKTDSGWQYPDLRDAESMEELAERLEAWVNGEVESAPLRAA